MKQGHGLRTISVLVLVVVAFMIGYYIPRTSDPFHSPARFKRALNDLESSDIALRKRALHEILDPIDYPLPDVDRQTRIAVGMMLGDESADIRSTATLRLSSWASRIHERDMPAYRRIVLAMSRTMAQDQDAGCRSIAAFGLESALAPGEVDREIAKDCVFYWKHSLGDRDSVVADLARGYMAEIPKPEG